MQQVKQGEATATRKRLWFDCLDATVPNLYLNIAAIGFVVTVYVIKADGSVVLGVGAVVQPDLVHAPGAGYYVPDATEIDTLGVARFVITGTGAGQTMLRRDVDVSVVAFDPYLQSSQSISVGDISSIIVEGPDQIDGGGETQTPVATPATNVTLVQILREIWAGVVGDAVGLKGTVAQFKSRAGGRNRAVAQLNNGNRTATSRDGS